jgi:hypothetical protein
MSASWLASSWQRAAGELMGWMCALAAGIRRIRPGHGLRRDRTRTALVLSNGEWGWACMCAVSVCLLFAAAVVWAAPDRSIRTFNSCQSSSLILFSPIHNQLFVDLSRSLSLSTALSNEMRPAGLPTNRSFLVCSPQLTKAGRRTAKRPAERLLLVRFALCYLRCLLIDDEKGRASGGFFFSAFVFRILAVKLRLRPKVRSLDLEAGRVAAQRRKAGRRARFGRTERKLSLSSCALVCVLMFTITPCQWLGAAAGCQLPAAGTTPATVTYGAIAKHKQRNEQQAQRLMMLVIIWVKVINDSGQAGAGPTH